MTWEERAVRWRLREVTKVEMERGRKVLTAHDRIRIDGEWWWWNKSRKVLVDVRRRSRVEKEKKREKAEKGRRG